MGKEHPVCVGTASVAGHSPPTYVCARYPGECRLKWRVAGKGEQVKKVAVEDGPVDVVVQAAKPAAPKKK
jgi:hypothetical protein